MVILKVETAFAPFITACFASVVLLQRRTWPAESIEKLKLPNTRIALGVAVVVSSAMVVAVTVSWAVVVSVVSSALVVVVIVSFAVVVVSVVSSALVVAIMVSWAVVVAIMVSWAVVVVGLVTQFPETLQPGSNTQISHPSLANT